MRFAVIADVRGNYLGLEAVLADIRAQGNTDIAPASIKQNSRLLAGRFTSTHYPNAAITPRRKSTAAASPSVRHRPGGKPFRRP
jgi:hypothetical protein